MKYVNKERPPIKVMTPSYTERVQLDDKKRKQRNKMTTLRSARLHIKTYSDNDTLEEIIRLAQIAYKRRNGHAYTYYDSNSKRRT